MFKLSLKFLVLSLTDVEREGNGRGEKERDEERGREGGTGREKGRK